MKVKGEVAGVALRRTEAGEGEAVEGGLPVVVVATVLEEEEEVIPLRWALSCASVMRVLFVPPFPFRARARFSALLTLGFEVDGVVPGVAAGMSAPLAALVEVEVEAGNGGGGLGGPAARW